MPCREISTNDDVLIVSRAFVKATKLRDLGKPREPPVYEKSNVIIVHIVVESI